MSPAWDRYLDEIEVAVCELEHALAAREAPHWPVPEPPPGRPPEETLARRDGLLARMVVAAHGIEVLRDGIRAKIESLPTGRRRAAVAYEGSLGTRFDVRG